MKPIATALLGAALGLLAPLAPAQDADAASTGPNRTGVSRAPQLALYAGCAAVFDSELITTTVGAEYRWAPAAEWWDVRPIAGLTYIDEENAYLFAGLRKDFPLWGELEFSPAWTFGLYEQGDLDLGHAVEFRTGFDLTHPLGERSRVGLGFYHLSNASFSDKNPGTETLVLSVTWDL